MKINYLQISNILSFKFYENINKAPKIEFDKNINYIIGENGSGKTTILEIINYVFTQILFRGFNFNKKIYKDNLISNHENYKQCIHINNTNKQNFRLNPNWNSIKKEREIQLEIEFDKIDIDNLKLLKKHKERFNELIKNHMHQTYVIEDEIDEIFENKYKINIKISKENKISIKIGGYEEKEYNDFCTIKIPDFGVYYMIFYNLFNILIDIHNNDTSKKINNLTEPFVIINCYRNYESFSKNIVSSEEYNENDIEKKEPEIFKLFGLRLSEIYQQLIMSKNDAEECKKIITEKHLNEINNKLKSINIKIEFDLNNMKNWSFQFKIIDIKYDYSINDINSLSAGQKSIIHLIFESYARENNIKGGFILIDEPELHLHYHYQVLYIKTIEKLNQKQNCQYILVTHSENLINYKNIDKVIRLSLDNNRYTKINKLPNNFTQENIIFIQNSFKALFGNRILLVEGINDEIFFKAILSKIEDKFNKGLLQNIIIINIGGNKNYTDFKNLYNESFGIETFFIGDNDCKKQKNFQNNNKTAFILKHKLENYINEYIHNKNVKLTTENTIFFVEKKLDEFLKNKDDEKVKEIYEIMSDITSIEKDQLIKELSC